MFLAIGCSSVATGGGGAPGADGEARGGGNSVVGQHRRGVGEIVWGGGSTVRVSSTSKNRPSH